ncbi:hypothetical protein KGQ71_01445, partial [Patescibacteria group bacterium]|nr:hypothetical protein [Patescibacteria group bacterium]
MNKLIPDLIMAELNMRPNSNTAVNSGVTAEGEGMIIPPSTLNSSSDSFLPLTTTDSSGNTVFATDASGNSSLGSTLWDDIQTQRRTIDQAFVNLYKLQLMLTTTSPYITIKDDRTIVIQIPESDLPKMSDKLITDLQNDQPVVKGLEVPHDLASTLKSIQGKSQTEQLTWLGNQSSTDPNTAPPGVSIDYPVSLKSFAQAYAPIYYLTVDPTDPNAAADQAKLQKTSLASWANSPFFQAAKYASDATASSQDCGSVSTYSLDIAQRVQVGICGAFVAFNKIPQWLLLSAVQLLAAVEGVTPPNSQNKSFLFDFLGNTFSGTIQKSLISTDPNTIGPAVKIASDAILQLLNWLLALVFLIMAIASILQIQVDNYGVNKLLPKVIIGFILAHFSFFAVRAALEVSDELASAVFEIPGRTTHNFKSEFSDQFVTNFSSVTSNDNVSFYDSTSKTFNMQAIIKQIILNLFVIVAACFIFVVAFLFIIRALIFALLMPIAPFAFFSQQIPPLKFVWDRWWKTTQGWIFMPVVANFWLLIAFLWFTTATSAASGIFSALTNYVFGMVALFLAIKTPFSMAGEAKAVMERWNAMGRRAGMEFTPYGSVRRGMNQVGETWKKREQLLSSGPVLQNSLVTGELGKRRLATRKGKLETDLAQLEKDHRAGTVNNIEYQARSQRMTEEIRGI